MLFVHMKSTTDAQEVVLKKQKDTLLLKHFKLSLIFSRII